MPRLSPERLRQLQAEAPDVYEAHIELLDVSARLWNALVWYGSESKKFRGRLFGLARTLAARAKDGKPDDYTTGMDTVVKHMARDGWANCHSG